jgi:hypothetical protein
MSDDNKPRAYVLTTLLLASLTTAEKAALVPTSPVAVEAFCRDIRQEISAALKPESHIEGREFKQPDSPHIHGPNPPAFGPPPSTPLPPFVQPEDGQQAVSLRYNQASDSAMAAMLASGMFGDTAILPPPVPFVDDAQPAVQMRFDHSYVNMAATGMLGDAAILPPKQA